MNNILLLEDLPEIRAWMKQLVLQVFPQSLISEAARVHDALELITAVKFDLALVDLGKSLYQRGMSNTGANVDFIIGQFDGTKLWNPTDTNI